jgi:hypothetical protein
MVAAAGTRPDRAEDEVGGHAESLRGAMHSTAGGRGPDAPETSGCRRARPNARRPRGNRAAFLMEAAMRKHRDFDDLPCFRHDA